MYAIAVAWSFRRGNEDLIRFGYREVMLPAARHRPGFRHGYVVRIAPDAWLTVLLFESQALLEAAMTELSPLIRRHHGRVLAGMQRYAGEVELEEAAMP
ncbi:MAG: hypothetical protein U0556_02935 [Dehalococcoidia bacterium]